MTNIGYKFIEKNMKSHNGDCEWKLNEWKKCDSKISLCNDGFHACKTPLQNLGYVYGDRWFVVEAKGKIIKGDDKFVASEMRLIKEIPVKQVVVRFACACARRSLKYWNKEYPDDDRPLKAIEVAEKYIKNPTADNLTKVSAAESAALSARSAWSAWSAAESARSAWSAALSARSARSAWSAAESARSAWSAALSARSAAESAVWSAESARSAAESAAWSARSAKSSRLARSAEKRWQNKILTKLIKEAI